MLDLIIYFFVSDHSPMLLCFKPKDFTHFHRTFRFENRWLNEPDLDQIVCDSWDKADYGSLTDKLEVVAKDLDEWGRKLAKRFRGKIEHCKQKLAKLRGVMDVDSQREFEVLKKELAKLLFEEESFWKQRAKTFWLKDGDLNTKFFSCSRIF